MNFLANENFPFPSIEILKNNSISVFSLSQELIGISDHQVIELALKGNYIILTFDKDYGEIIFKENIIHPPSVIFFRYKGINPEFAGIFLLEIIKKGEIILENHFTVIEENGIRQRKY